MGNLKRLVSLVTAFVIVFGCVSTGFSADVDALEIEYAVSQTQDRTSYFSTEFTLTGNYADDVLAVARAQMGKTTTELHYSEAWCANLSNDCARLTVMHDNIIPYNYGMRASCLFMYKYMLSDCGAYEIEDMGDIRAGDYVFYYCPASNFYLHVGIVESHDYYIEGNYSNMVRHMPFNYNYKCYQHYGAGNDFDSGHVKRIYVRPNYPEPPKEYTYTSTEKYADYVPARVLKYKEPVTSCGFDVCWVQTILFRLGYLNAVTGEYNLDTQTAVRSFQYDYELEETGEVDETVVEALMSAYDESISPACKSFSADKEAYYLNQPIKLKAVVSNTDDYSVIVKDSYNNQVKYFDNMPVCTFNASDIGIGNFTAYINMTNSYKTVCSDAISFTVEDPHPPEAEVKAKAGTSFKSTEISWSRTKNTLSYDLYINNKTTGDNVLTRKDLSGQSYSLLLPVGNYNAYVVSKNDVAQTKSKSHSFYVGKGNAVDLGESFYAAVSLNEQFLSYNSDSNSAELSSGNKSNNYVWYFLKNNNSNSYSIRNCDNGKALTVSDTNTFTCTEFNDAMSQRWFVAQGRNGYYLIPTYKKNMTLCGNKDSLILRVSENEIDEGFGFKMVSPVHNYLLTEVTAPTCTENGHVSYKCAVCGEEFEKTIKAVGHSYIKTGVSDGRIVYTCEYCGDSYVSEKTAPAETPDTPDSPDQAGSNQKSETIPKEIKTQSLIFGDVDSDGKITSNDSLLIIRASVGLEKLTDIGMVIADVDCDGKITSADGLFVLREVVHLYTETKVRDVMVIESNLSFAVLDDSDSRKKE